MEAEYLLKKGMLNSLYGMCVTDICKDEENCTFEKGWWTDPAEGREVELIDKYNKDPNRFLSYAWGVFITAYARRNLFTGIMSMGKDYVYCDTDSIKFLNMEKHKGYIEDYNRNIKFLIELVEHLLNVSTICQERIKPGLCRQSGAS